jgi:acyl-coenzyme A thioesterase PaaI-like protein
MPFMISSTFIERAKHSKFYLWMLNAGLARMIPFNKPHGFRILNFGDYHIELLIPYKRKNLNHIRGLHACALATLSEYGTGLLLISRLGFDTYRIIMQRLEMDYHYQGKMDATAHFSISPEWLQQHILEPLKSQESVIVVCEIKIIDAQGKHLTTGKVHWQIKEWKRVKTKT